MKKKFKNRNHALERSNEKHLLRNIQASNNYQPKLGNYHAEVREKQIKRKIILTRKERRKIYKNYFK